MFFWINIAFAALAFVMTLITLFIHAPYRGALTQFFAASGGLAFAIWAASTGDELRGMVALLVSGGLMLVTVNVARSVIPKEHR